MLPVATVHIVSAMTELVADYDYDVIFLILQSGSTNQKARRFRGLLMNNVINVTSWEAPICQLSSVRLGVINILF